jgi:hypothetical protein
VKKSSKKSISIPLLTETDRSETTTERVHILDSDAVSTMEELMCEIVETREEHGTLEKYLSKDEFKKRRDLKEKIALK